MPRLLNMSGKHNAAIRYWKDGRSTIEYTDETGKHSGHFMVNMKDSLDWIKTNTPEDSVFLCWWDYGHMVKGWAERNVVIRNPSKEILKSVTDPSKVKEFDSHEIIVDVATAFSATDPNETLQIMQKYGASYVLVHEEDRYKALWIFWTAGLDTTEYGHGYYPQEAHGRFSDKAKDTIIARLLENRETTFFTLVYSDETTKVYKLKLENPEQKPEDFLFQQHPSAPKWE